MKVKKVVLDEKIKNCILCPLVREYKRDCGKETSTNVNGGVVYGKVPDGRCKIR